MSSPNSIAELVNLKVSIDEVLYMPSLAAPVERPHPFAYFITIENQSEHTVTVKARKWVVEEESGQTQVVEGVGVVGQIPTIPVGSSFSYNSYHTVAENASVSGSFLVQIPSKQLFFTPIPGFRLVVPTWGF